MIEVQTATGVVRPTVIKVRDSGGIAQSVQIVQVRDPAGVAQTVWAAISASASPSTADGYSSSATPRAVGTNNVTVTVEGGVGALTYSWAVTAGWSATVPNGATTNFVSPVVAPGDSDAGTMTCTVTDSVGQAATVNVSATVTNSYYSGGFIP